MLTKPRYGRIFFAPDSDGAGTGDDGKGGESKEDSTTGGESKDGDSKDDAAGLKSALDKEREARKALEKEHKAIAKKLADLENAGKSDTEKLQAEKDRLERQLQTYAEKARTAAAKDAVRQAAKDAGAPDPDLIYRLVRSDISFDDDGEPTNVADLIRDEKARSPELFKTKPGNPDRGGGKDPPQSKADMNAWIRQAAGRG